MNVKSILQVRFEKVILLFCGFLGVIELISDVIMSRGAELITADIAYICLVVFAHMLVLKIEALEEKVRVQRNYITLIHAKRNEDGTPQA